jgi:Flp pilus assembly pilin Flp
MNFITTRFAALRRDTKGQDLLEYALLVALIAVVCATAVGLAGTEVKNIFGDIKDALITPAA